MNLAGTMKTLFLLLVGLILLLGSAHSSDNSNNENININDDDNKAASHGKVGYRYWRTLLLIPLTL